MRPQDALAELSAQARVSVAEPDKPAPFTNGINHTYSLLRRYIAIAAFLLPIGLWIGGSVQTHSLWPNPSISQYYHSPGGWTRDYLVATLSIIGFFLYFYRGYSTTEDIVLNVAGASAAMVAFAPMEFQPALCAEPRLFPAWTHNSSWLSLHGLSAMVLFGCLAYVCIWRADDTLGLLRNKHQRMRFKRNYRILGTAMIVVPVIILLSNWIQNLIPHKRVFPDTLTFSLEFVGIYIFGLYWLEKSYEIEAIQEQR